MVTIKKRLSPLQLVKVKVGRNRSILIYKKKCVVCGEAFPAPGPSRLTCGRQACKNMCKAMSRPSGRVKPYRLMLSELERLSKVESKVLPPSYSPRYFKEYGKHKRAELSRKRRERYHVQLMLRELKRLASS